ncbi:MAG: 16S rRNA (guanine(966)-N(2))-methyltransferase RsmD [Candidatus Cloacimonetes bacterium]|nr:16S rRNA (guanine(966)-N(2))-methyltransferase RsmD [Candidatus Cloacimonadota bacterium]
MRIITGKFKKRTLFSVPGNTTRPTTDYLKEVIFSIIQNYEDKKILDLFAGSGSLGLEALSRGAESVVFVDLSYKAINTMNRNIQNLDCVQSCRIYRKKVSAFLKKSTEQFDMIFMDPPYDRNLVNPTIELILENNLINSTGKIIVEHSKDEILDEKWTSKFEKQKISGKSQITVLGEINENI